MSLTSLFLPYLNLAICRGFPYCQKQETSKQTKTTSTPQEHQRLRLFSRNDAAKRRTSLCDVSEGLD